MSVKLDGIEVSRILWRRLQLSETIILSLKVLGEDLPFVGSVITSLNQAGGQQGKPEWWFTSTLNQRPSFRPVALNVSWQCRRRTFHEAPCPGLNVLFTREQS